MRLRCIAPFFAAIACAACAPAPQGGDDTAVLRAALENTCADRRLKLAVLADTVADREHFSLPPAWSVQARYWRQLHLQHINSAAWQRGALCANVRVVDQKDIDTALAAAPQEAPGWRKFYDTFDGARGYSTYSRPIYSADGTHALIFTEHRCEGHCGLGEVIELEWAAGRWRAIRTALTWIS
jgi:hypothetical protein